MIILLSPAKIMNFKTPSPFEKFTQPEFLADAGKIIELLRNLNMDDLAKLLDINSNLTKLNFDRIFNWHCPFTRDNAKQAVTVFDGEVFRGLDANTFTETEADYAQKHLRILSGLYGVLRPLDLIQAYRLEVSSKLSNPFGNDLYAFWREKVTGSVLQSLKKSGKPQLLLNLASDEYFKTLDLKNRNVRVIHVEFYEYKNDKFRQVVIYTKKARGLMARYVIENQIENEEELKGFDKAGYWYYPQLSGNDKLVFVRG
jgi:cytoplasmic iron level regulating protein YaaA (DUF328/UPF0246 family)